MTNKEKFLEEHNKLSPKNMQADLDLLGRFKEAKLSLFKDNDWSIDKLRRPFILWLTSLPAIKKEDRKKETTDKSKQLFHIYPSEEA